MLRKFVLSAALLGALGSMGGCMSLNWDENTRMIDHWGRDADESRKLANKYFFNYDADNPFED